MGYWIAWSIHPTMYGHSSVFSILLPGPSDLLFLNYESQNRGLFSFEQKLMDFLPWCCCFALHFKWKSNETELWMFITLIPLVSPGCLLACVCGNVCTRELTWFVANTSQITLCCLMDYKWSRNNRLWNTSGADRVKKAEEESRRLFRFCLFSFQHKATLLHLKDSTDFVVLQPYW